LKELLGERLVFEHGRVVRICDEQRFACSPSDTDRLIPDIRDDAGPFDPVQRS